MGCHNGYIVRNGVLNMKTIKNRAEIIEQLTDMLMKYDKDL